MRNVWTVAWREFRQFFGSPIAYALAIVVFGFLGALFALQFSQVVSSSASSSGGATSMEGQVILGPLMTLFLFGLPALTMRLFSEENRQGTLEILLTSPVRDGELVLGKWLGALMFSTIILALTWIFPIFLNAVTTNGIDQGPLVSSYIVFFLLTGSLLAIGLVFSSLFANSIAAFFSSLAVGLLLWLSGMFSSLSTVAGSSGGTSWLSSLFNYLDFTSHFYNSAYAGKLDLTDIVYYLSIIIFGLFLTTQIVQSKRWR